MLGENEFQGKTQVSVQAKAIKLSSTNDEEVIKSLHAYEDFCALDDFSDELKEIIRVDRDFCGNVYKFVKANILMKQKNI